MTKKSLTKKDHKHVGYSVLFDKETKTYKLVTIKFHEQGTAFVESIETLDSRLAVASMKSHDKFNELIKSAGNDEIESRRNKNIVDTKSEIDNNDDI